MTRAVRRIEPFCRHWQFALDASVTGVHIEINLERPGEVNLHASIGGLNLRCSCQVRAIRDRQIDAAIAGMDLQSCESPIDCHRSVRRARLQRSRQIMHVNRSIAGRQPHRSTHIVHTYRAVAGVQFDIPLHPGNFERTIGCSRFQVNLCRNLRNDLWPVVITYPDVNSQMHLFLKFKIHMISGLELGQSEIVYSAIAPIHANLNVVAASAGADLERRIPGADRKGRFAGNRVRLLPLTARVLGSCNASTQNHDR